MRELLGYRVHIEIPTSQRACHSVTSEKQAQYLKACLVKRFADCGLKLNEEKTKIVYCKDSNRKGNSECTAETDMNPES